MRTHCLFINEGYHERQNSGPHRRGETRSVSFGIAPIEMSGLGQRSHVQRQPATAQRRHPHRGHGHAATRAGEHLAQVWR